MKFAVLKSKIKLKLFASILSSVILTSVSAVALSQPIDEGNKKRKEKDEVLHPLNNWT